MAGCPNLFAPVSALVLSRFRATAVTGFSIGTILLWYDYPDARPINCELCDGNNGTPDLRNRFIWGKTVQGSIDTTGGTNVHTHDFTAGVHGHTWPGIGAGVLGPGPGPLSSTPAVTGTTDSESNLPKYMGLTYIQVVS